MNKLVASLLVSTTAAADWNYLQHGADWGEGCTYAADGSMLTNQTPINLWTHDHPEFDRYPQLRDHYDWQSYQNQWNREVVMNGHTSQTNVEPEAGDFLGFGSDIPQMLFGAPDPIDFHAKQFHFHSPSEHTYNGQYFDLEMHTVHLEEQGNTNGFIAAALGIMFSVDNYNARLEPWEEEVIYNFFESMGWNNETKTHQASQVPYGDLINMVDFHNRWVYQGSVTTPPCAQKVFWNQISTVYPISQYHLDMFKNQLAQVRGVYEPQSLAEVGNYREIQIEDNHNVHYVSNPNDPRHRVWQDGDGGHWGEEKGWEEGHWEEDRGGFMDDVKDAFDDIGDMLEDAPNISVEQEDDTLVIRISGAVKAAVASALTATLIAANF